MHINAASASAGPGSADGAVAVAADGAGGVVGQDGLQDAQSGSQTAWQFITVSLTAMASLLTLAAAAAETGAETAASVVAIC